MHGTYCTGGRCQPLLANGAACSEAGQCMSGNCADGYCCNTACSGACQSCGLAGMLGTCGTQGFASDPNNCGRCGNQCSANHLTRTCSGGQCSGACAAGWAGLQRGQGRRRLRDQRDHGCQLRWLRRPVPGTNCLGRECERIEFSWSSAGPIPGRHCVAIAELADPHTWSDNFLCTQRDFGFVWSSAGPAPAFRVQWQDHWTKPGPGMTTSSAPPAIMD